MSLPIKCFTCGYVIADKHEWYLSEVKRRKAEKNTASTEGGMGMHATEQLQYLRPGNIQKSIEGEVMDDLQLVKDCCRRHFLTHV